MGHESSNVLTILDKILRKNVDLVFPNRRLLKAQSQITS
jgi:hypothetical protein